ncbi:MAG: hypothetical protein KME25_08375 [Symplocastrum torsivum CPER-KK1]|jgi:hypothetical protein|uniref:Uncharacterized protein n=1 Tax=Symplocastrum torsivum CPER-KK1 TaxID=450513 RepID=A0A951PIQ6_9CYAN|nr:hypothetical protein [Symplocastrum torsivum CPER-KK1]
MNGLLLQLKSLKFFIENLLPKLSLSRGNTLLPVLEKPGLRDVAAQTLNAMEPEFSRPPELGSQRRHFPEVSAGF